MRFQVQVTPRRVCTSPNLGKGEAVLEELFLGGRGQVSGKDMENGETLSYIK
jgi:hypothetical protein